MIGRVDVVSLSMMNYFMKTLGDGIDCSDDDDDDVSEEHKDDDAPRYHHEIGTG